MEMSAELLSVICRPSFILRDPQLDAAPSSTCRADPWPDSPLNPKNRPDSLDTKHSGWRVDGAGRYGTQLFAFPASRENLPPLGVFVHLPDQTSYPPALRVCLGANRGASLRHGPSFAKLGIANHVCLALDAFCARDPGFLDRYVRLPFGSRLVFTSVTPAVADMVVAIEANYELERRALTPEGLRAAWDRKGAEGGARITWPPFLDMDYLRLITQVHDTVSIVQIRDHGQYSDHSPGLPGTAAFKSTADSYDHLLHELRCLLTVPPHEHIMPRPIAIVFKKANFGGKKCVVGFLMEYFPVGSMRDVLPYQQINGQLDMATKLTWCREVASALVHIQDKTDLFFSELRPDNVLLREAMRASGTGKTQEGKLVTVLCDFEQRGNWHEWCAPEVLYRQYVENIRVNIVGKKVIDHKLGLGLLALLDKYATAPHARGTPAYKEGETRVEAANRSWFALPTMAREKATVYSLGLFIYTVFEGQSSLGRSVGNQWIHEPAVSFPQFGRTPARVRDIVMRCVSGPAQKTFDGGPGDDSPRGVIGVDGWLFPKGRTDLPVASRDAAEAVMAAAADWWMYELKQAVAFTQQEEWETAGWGHGRPRLEEVMHALSELSLDDLD